MGKYTVHWCILICVIKILIYIYFPAGIPFIIIRPFQAFRLYLWHYNRHDREFFEMMFLPLNTT